MINTQTADRTLSTSDPPWPYVIILPYLSFQASEPRPYLQSLPRGDCDAEIRTLPYLWQETLWLACCPTFSVGETSIHPEAPPILECDEGINTHCDPQRESCPLVRPLSGWTIRYHNGLDMSLGPNL